MESKGPRVFFVAHLTSQHPTVTVEVDGTAHGGIAPLMLAVMGGHQGVVKVTADVEENDVKLCFDTPVTFIEF